MSEVASKTATKAATRAATKAATEAASELAAQQVAEQAAQKSIEATLKTFRPTVPFILGAAVTGVFLVAYKQGQTLLAVRKAKQDEIDADNNGHQESRA